MAVQDEVVEVSDHEPDQLVEVSAEALDDIVTGLAQVPRVVAGGEGDEPGVPRSRRLLGTSHYDVWLITWPPGSELADHDHGEAVGVMRLVAGSLVEDVQGGRRDLRPGRSITTPPGVSHHLANPGTADATSIHAYAPPLIAIAYRDPALPVATVRARRAEATGPVGAAPSPERRAG